MAATPSNSPPLSEEQQQMLKTLRRNCHQKLSLGVSPEDLVLLENPKSLDWSLAMLAYPTLCFLLADIVYRFGELDNQISQMTESRPELLDDYNPFFSLGTARRLDNWKNGELTLRSDTTPPGEFRTGRNSLEYLEALAKVVQADMARKLEGEFESVNEHVRLRWQAILLEVQRRQTIFGDRYTQENVVFNSSVLRQRMITNGDSDKEMWSPDENQKEVSPYAGDDSPCNSHALRLQGISPTNEELLRILSTEEQPIVVDSKALTATKARKILEAASHPKTVAFSIPSILAASSFLIGVSITRPRLNECRSSAFDDGFYASLSQLLIQLLSLYCLVIPLIRSHSIPSLAFWFYVGICGLSITVSTITYSFNWQVAGVFAFLSGVFGVTATAQLIEGVDATVKKPLRPEKIKRL